MRFYLPSIKPTELYFRRDLAIVKRPQPRQPGPFIAAIVNIATVRAAQTESPLLEDL